MNVPHTAMAQNDEPPKEVDGSLKNHPLSPSSHEVAICYNSLTHVCWFILHSIPILAGYFLFLSHCQADMARKSRPGCSSNERHHIVSGRRRSRRGWETRRDSCHCPGWPMVWKVLKQAFCVGQRLVQWRNLNINITRIDGDYAGKTVVNGWWNGGVAIRTIAFQVVYDIA